MRCESVVHTHCATELKLVIHAFPIHLYEQGGLSEFMGNLGVLMQKYFLPVEVEVFVVDIAGPNGPTTVLIEFHNLETVDSCQYVLLLNLSNFPTQTQLVVLG